MGLHVLLENRGLFFWGEFVVKSVTLLFNPYPMDLPFHPFRKKTQNNTKHTEVAVVAEITLTNPSLDFILEMHFCGAIGSKTGPRSLSELCLKNWDSHGFFQDIRT